MDELRETLFNKVDIKFDRNKKPKRIYKNSLTELGRKLRKIRISNGELLKDMASNLNLGCAELSSIEFGKKEPPSNLFSNVYEIYGVNLDDEVEAQ